MTRARSRFVPSLLVALLAIAPPARAAFRTLEEIPVESPTYRMVEELATSHGLGTAFLHTRPWQLRDLADALDAIARRAPEAATDPLMLRLRRELAPSEAPGGWAPLVAASDSVSAVELSPYASASYSEDRARRAVARDFRAGVQGALALGDGALVAADVYAGTTSPGPHGNPVESRHFGLVENVQVNSYFDRGTIALRNRWGRVTLGHTWLRWGPGAWAGMALADGARAMDVAEVRVPITGRAQLEWFVAELDPLAERFLAGHRLELRPAANWDVAVAELARFDGTSQLPLYLLPAIPYSLVEKRVLKASDPSSAESTGTGKNNVMWAADVAWRVRPGLRAYGELAVDDVSFSSEKRPRALGWQAGFDARRRAGRGAWTVRGEYARVHPYTYSVWHHHDFAFAGYSTAFPPGPDVERVNARLEWRTGPDAAFGIEGARTRKGEGALGQPWVAGAPTSTALTGVVERDTRVALTADWSPAPGLDAGLVLGTADVRAKGHVAGTDASGAFGQLRVRVRR